MELGELKAFVTVAPEHSFSRAAIKLCRTQPAVSQAIRRLEEDLAACHAGWCATADARLTGATTDSALPTGSFLIMPGVDSLKQAVANGLGIGIVPRAAVSSLTTHPGLVVIPLLAARAASALTLVYRDNDRRPNAVEDFVEVLRSTGEDCVSRKAPAALRVSR